MARPTLVVAVVRDNWLRAALADHLRRMGVNVLDAGARERSYLRRPGLLLLSENDIEGEAGRWVEGQWREGRWRSVSVVTIESGMQAVVRLDSLLHDWSGFGIHRARLPNFPRPAIKVP